MSKKQALGKDGTLGCFCLQTSGAADAGGADAGGADAGRADAGGADAGGADAGGADAQATGQVRYRRWCW